MNEEAVLVECPIDGGPIDALDWYCLTCNYNGRCYVCTGKAEPDPEHPMTCSVECARELSKQERC